MIKLLDTASPGSFDLRIANDDLPALAVTRLRPATGTAGRMTLPSGLERF
jgi:hypothetical protein